MLGNPYGLILWRKSSRTCCSFMSCLVWKCCVGKAGAVCSHCLSLLRIGEDGGALLTGSSWPSIQNNQSLCFLCPFCDLCMTMKLPYVFSSSGQEREVRVLTSTMNIKIKKNFFWLFTHFWNCPSQLWDTLSLRASSHRWTMNSKPLWELIRNCWYCVNNSIPICPG